MNHYRTMPLEAICALPVPDLAADNAHLYLWATAPMLPEALQVMDRWGFTYKSNMVWVKPQMAMGNYFRVSHELLLFGVRGKLPTLRKDIFSWVPLPRTTHSTKPDFFYDIIESASPGPYLELFARRARPGWTVWGDEVCGGTP